MRDVAVGRERGFSSLKKRDRLRENGREWGVVRDDKRIDAHWKQEQHFVCAK